MTTTDIRSPNLTERQKEICRQNCNRFPAEIITLYGMEGTSKRQVAEYLRKPGVIPLDHELADDIDTWIVRNGLPQQYSAVLDFVAYLRDKN